MVSTLDGACVEWATARVVAPGHSDSGDQCCVRTIDQRTMIPMNDGDTLVFATDGVGPEIDDRLLKGHSLQVSAERILARCRTGHDDALVLLARYRGAGR